MKYSVSILHLLVKANDDEFVECNIILTYRYRRFANELLFVYSSFDNDNNNMNMNMNVVYCFKVYVELLYTIRRCRT